MHLCKEMRNTYASMENQLQTIKETLELKDAEMIRLSHENSALEKTNIQLNIELDHFRHNDSKGLGDESIIEKELENSKQLVENLTNKIHTLKEQNSQLIEEVETLRMEKKELLNFIKGWTLNISFAIYK